MWHPIYVTESVDLPNFKIPHAEKIEWMIETNGWALEPVPADTTTVPPQPRYSYTIGMHECHAFPEIIVFGLAPIAIKGLIDLVVEQIVGGVEIPRNIPLTGLLDNDLRCIFSPVDLDNHTKFFDTAIKWHRGGSFEVLQFVWPDRNGWLPNESGFDQTLKIVQPLIGTFV
jgi:Domain of unknown function (DUF4262)